MDELEKKQFVGAQKKFIGTCDKYQIFILAFLGGMEEVEEFKRWGVNKWGKWGLGEDTYFEMNLLSWFNFYFNSNNYFIINLLSDSAILNFTFFIWLSVLVFNFRSTGNNILISEWWTIIGIRWPNFAIQFKIVIPIRNCNVFRS